MTGAWTMTDEGEFVLNEPYKSQLSEAKHRGAIAWQFAMFEYLDEVTIYNVEYLAQEFMSRVQRNDGPVQTVDEFIIEALEGNL